MCKRLISLASFVLVLAMVGDAVGAVVTWTDAGPDHLWSTAANWDTDTLPTSADKARIPALPGPTIRYPGAVANNVPVGAGSSTGALTVDGGTLTTTTWLIFGYSSGGSGTLYMNSGNITVGNNFYVGFEGSGTLNMTGGTITVMNSFAIPKRAGGTGHVNLDGGVITSKSFAMSPEAGAVGTMDITAGTLIIDGDVRTTIQGYVDNGWITAYSGDPNTAVKIDYNLTNPGKTTVTASMSVPNTTDPNKPNIIFIMTDQQRFDAIGRVQDELAIYNGMTKIRTPNLDQLSQDGVYFRNAYTHCAVCAPARTTLRTGCTLERHGAQSNDLVKEKVYTLMPQLFQNKIENVVTLDHILVEDMGYVSEYYGKFHLPEIFFEYRASTTNVITYNDYNYANSTFWLNPVDGWGSFYKTYLKYFNNQGEITKTFPDGTQKNTFSKYAYYPVQLDVRYGMATNTSLTSPPFEPWETSQPNVMGEDILGDKYTPSGTNGDIGVKALDRLCQQNAPFLLTISFHNPHAPMVATSKYFDYYWNNRTNLLVPQSIDDNMNNSAYQSVNRNLLNAGYGYNDPAQVQEWTACYYSLVEEIDDWIGSILATLDLYPNVRDNTLIIFTSDHGEMLGAHAMREKNIFLEELAHVPLIAKFPGHISTGTIVDESVSTLDVFSTILDYLNASSYDNSDGKSLRGFIEKTYYNKDYDEEHIVTEWDFRPPLNANDLQRSLGREINFLSKKGPYKLMMTKKASSTELDMMYNLDDDPYEMDNLVGDDGMTASDEVIGKAEHLKALLIDWMARMDGTDNLYSDPVWNNGEGLGDIGEIRTRRKWKELDLWVSDRTVVVGTPANVLGTWTRNEWIYLGRGTNGTTNVSSISVEGADAGKFALSSFTGGNISQDAHEKIKVQYTPSSQDEQITDAKIRIRHNTGADILITLTNTSGDVVLDNCDSDAGWGSSNTLTVDTQNKQEGDACLREWAVEKTAS